MARGWTDGPTIVAGGSGGEPPFPRIPNIPLGVVRTALVAVAAFLFLATSYYQVEPDEEAVVLRFGRNVRTSGPGPHLKIPFGVEQVVKVAVQRQHKMEFGFRTAAAAARTRYEDPDAEKAAEATMLTGDLNVAVVEWIVQYRIQDPAAYLFNVRDPDETFRYMAEASMREVVGDHSVDEVITIGRETIALQAKEELQRLCTLYEIGIEVQQLVLQDVNPPDPVRPAFNEVNQAIQEKERAINEAWADYNKEVPRAKGEADQQVRAAEGYALERVNEAEGNASRFESVLEEYRKAPVVTRRRLYLETLARVLPKTGRKVVIDDDVRGILPLLGVDGQLPEVKK